MEEFSAIVKELKHQLDDVDALPPVFIRHFLASFMNDRLKVRMYKEGNHSRPHIHIYYKKEYSASVAIDNAELLSGKIPNKYFKVIRLWVNKYKDYLLQQWNNMQAGKEPMEFEGY